MTMRESLAKVLTQLPDDRLRQLLEFAEFLAIRSERAEWSEFGRQHFAQAYGPDEPEYSMANVKSRGRP